MIGFGYLLYPSYGLQDADAVFKHPVGLAEMAFLVGVGRVNGNISNGTRTQVPTVTQAQNPPAGGAGHDGYLTQRELFLDVLQQTHGDRLGMKLLHTSQAVVIVH